VIQHTENIQRQSWARGLLRTSWRAVRHGLCRRLLRALIPMRHTLRLLSCPLALALIAANDPSPRNALHKEVSLLSMVQRPSPLRSFDIYHVSDMSTHPITLTVDDLVASKDASKDVLHITATREIEEALSATTVKGLCEMQVYDVRWAIVLNFQDGSRAVLGFKFYSNVDCVVVQSQPNVVAVSRPFFDYVVKRFGFLSP
jgi:hypothetical protein